MRTFMDAKAMAKAMREALAARNVDLTHSEALEIVARQFGFDNWNILSSRLSGGQARQRDREEAAFEPAVPIFRIFDEGKAREFYKDFLGCRVDWEHRFAPEAPLYMQVSRGRLCLHLSEHSGDATPGGNAVVFIRNIAVLHRELIDKDYKYNRPGLETRDWGVEMGVIDPFGNRLRFIERGED